MRIFDLTDARAHILATDPSAKKIFEHYSTFWAGENFQPIALSPEEIVSRRSLLLRHLQTAEERLRAAQFPIEPITAALLVGSGTSNGHAFLDKDNAIAWFAIECFRSELEAKVFVMHELIHALHYHARPEFGFHSLEEKNSVLRQLVTEGIATYLTRQIWILSDEEALWADSIPNDQLRSWMQACENSERELCEFVVRHFDSSDPKIQLFYASNPDNIFSFRAGYYAGLKVMEAICDKHGFKYGELLTIPFQEMHLLVSNVLSQRNLNLHIASHS